MRINYHETRKDLCEFFHDLVRRSPGYYAISQNGDFFKTNEARWSYQNDDWVYPDYSILFNVMRDDRIEFIDTIHKLS